jgi:hypothetical protein
MVTRISFDSLYLTILNHNPELNRLATDLAIFDVFLAAGTEVHKKIELLRTVGTKDQTRFFHQ